MTEAQILVERSFNSSGESVFLEYKTPFMDHKEGEGILVNPRSILRIKVERTKVCWIELRFEAKSEGNVTFANWAPALLANIEENHSDWDR